MMGHRQYARPRPRVDYLIERLDKDGFLALEKYGTLSASQEALTKRPVTTALAVWELGWPAAVAGDSEDDIDRRLAEANAEDRSFSEYLDDLLIDIGGEG